MQIEFVHVGYGGTIAVNRILAIASPDSAPIKRLVRTANKEGRIINLTYGHRAKTVIVLDSGHVVLAAFQPQIILRRIQEYRLRGNRLELAMDERQAEAAEEEAVEREQA